MKNRYLIDVILESVTTMAGNIPVYHYTKKDMGDVFTASPKDSVKHRSSYSANDYKHSAFPRIFFYTDLNKTEHQVRSSFLYSGTVDGSRILNLHTTLTQFQTEKDELRKRNKNAFDVVHELFKDGRPNYDAMFKKASKLYDGIFYETGGIPMIVLFKPIELKRHE